MSGNIQKHSAEATPPSATPQHPLMSLRDEVDRLFDNFFPTVARRGLFDMDPFRRLGGVFRASGDLAPEVDVRETGDKFEIAAELPGMDEAEIEVKVSGGVLSIAGEKRLESKEDKADYHLSERSYGRFMRAFRLPETADEEHIAAEFAKGVLTVTVPKRQEAAKREKKIDVKMH